MVEGLKFPVPPVVPAVERRGSREELSRPSPTRPTRDDLDGDTASLIQQTLSGQFRWLAFPAALECRYADETTRDRIESLRNAGTAITFLMNLFLWTDYVMVHDVFEQALQWRVWGYTPIVLLGLWLIGKFKHVGWHEFFAVMAGVLAACIQIGLCLISESPYAQAYLTGLAMVIFFSNVFSRVRFWRALPLNGFYLLMYGVGVFFLPSHHWELTIPIGLILSSTALFTLYHLYMQEYEERHNYLLVLHQRVLSTDLSRANAELDRVSRMDPLTEVANRRHFDEYLGQLWERASRNNDRISVLMLDIDHFKRFNDRYGHPAGDACLMQVAQALRKSLRRPGDLVARYGGEEFIVVLYKATPDQVAQAAERIRAAVEALDIPHQESPIHLRVTVSVGMASMHPDEKDASAQALIHQADQALYQAKNRGRNRAWGAEVSP